MATIYDSAEMITAANDGGETKNINNEIKVEMENQMNITKEVDVDSLITRLENKVYESMENSAEGVHI